LQKTWIKICGITRALDALAAAELGADAIGVVIYPKSPRAVTVDELAGITAGREDHGAVVPLSVDQEPELARTVIQTGSVNLLQFHGSESPEFCDQFALPYMTAVAVKGDSNLQELIAPYDSARYILLDSYDPIMQGGTGKTFAWITVERCTAR